VTSSSSCFLGLSKTNHDSGSARTGHKVQRSTLIAGHILSPINTTSPASSLSATATTASRATFASPSSTAKGNEASSASSHSVASTVSHEVSKLYPTQYTVQQLSALTVPYKYHWTSAAYFVVVFGSLVVAAFTFLALVLLTRACVDRHRKKDIARTIGDGESYLITERRNGLGIARRPRPSTRILEALRGKKISPPLESEDGHTGSGAGSHRVHSPRS